MDVFRKEYKELTDLQKAEMALIKEEAQSLWDMFEAAASNQPSKARYLALAKTNLEQAVMWAVKGITA